MLLHKIISGGSTGADHGALDAALTLGFETGGTMPQNFYTEDGTGLIMREKYNMIETIACKSLKQSLVMRSIINVNDADATVVFRVLSSPGSDKTISYALTKKWKPLSRDWKTLISSGSWYKPVMVIEDMRDVGNVAKEILAFLNTHNVRILNVAGHRESRVKDFSIFQATRDIIISMLGYILDTKMRTYDE